MIVAILCISVFCLIVCLIMQFGTSDYALWYNDTMGGDINEGMAIAIRGTTKIAAVFFFAIAVLSLLTIILKP